MCNIRSLIKALGGSGYIPSGLSGDDGMIYDSIRSEFESALGELVPPAKRERLVRELAANPTADNRYRLEYENNCYRTVKLGIDGKALERVLRGVYFKELCVVEIGGGPSMIAREAKVGICLDIACCPKLTELGVRFVEGDICQSDSVERCLEHIPKKLPTLIALSYCLDRVHDQAAALKNFSRLITETAGIGLITVCLPARPVSPGDSRVKYDEAGRWITTGESAEGDYCAIVRRCQQEGLKFVAGGLTEHFGISFVDGFEQLPCYTQLFNFPRGRLNSCELFG